MAIVDCEELVWSANCRRICFITGLESNMLFYLCTKADFSVDYLRSGLPRDAYARARVNRSGRRYASVYVEAWQDNRSRIFAQATGHFLMPDSDS